MLRYNLLLFIQFLGLLFYTAASVAAEQPSIASVAERLIITTDFVTNVMHIICIVVGMTLVIMSFFLYKAHRVNPKYVPLDRPVVYLLLGLVLLVIPFAGALFGPTGNSKDLVKQQKTQRSSGVTVYDVDAPLEWGNDYDH